MAAELEKLKAHEQKTLDEIRAKIAESSSSADSADSDSSSGSSLLSLSPSDLFTSESAAAEKARKSQSSKKVQQEIEKLRQTLGQRKVVAEVPKEVESA